MCAETPSVRSDTKKPSPFQKKTPHPQTQLSPPTKTQASYFLFKKKTFHSHRAPVKFTSTPDGSTERKAAPIWWSRCPKVDWWNWSPTTEGRIFFGGNGGEKKWWEMDKIYWGKQMSIEFSTVFFLFCLMYLEGLSHKIFVRFKLKISPHQLRINPTQNRRQKTAFSH